MPRYITLTDAFAAANAPEGNKLMIDIDEIADISDYANQPGKPYKTSIETLGADMPSDYSDTFFVKEDIATVKAMIRAIDPKAPWGKF